MISQDIFNWLGAASFLVAILTAAYTTVSSRAKASKDDADARTRATKEQVDEVQDQIDLARHIQEAYGNRLTALEERVRSMPTQQAMDGVNSKLGELHGDSQNMLGKLDSMEKQVGLITEWLINGKGRS